MKKKIKEEKTKMFSSCLRVLAPLCSKGAKEFGTMPTSLKAFMEGRYAVELGLRF
jgi:hypothetical protein